MTNKPKKWIAALLGLISPPIGLLYAAQLKLALVYLFIALLVAVLSILSPALSAATEYAALILAALGAIHAYLSARKYPEEMYRPAYSRWYAVIGAAAGLLVLIVGIRAFVFEPFRFPSSSMLPTVEPRAGLIVRKWGYGNYGTYGKHFLHTPISSPLSRGDIIVFESRAEKSLMYMQRLVGLPGDKIAYRGRQLFVNGNAAPLRPDGEYFDPESLKYIPRFVESLMGTEYSVLIEGREGKPGTLPPPFPFFERCTYRIEEVSCQVPTGHFFTLGDNRDNSYDSRFRGFVPEDHIVGKVVFIGQ